MYFFPIFNFKIIFLSRSKRILTKGKIRIKTIKINLKTEQLSKFEK